jgi:hypothetical protein
MWWEDSAHLGGFGRKVMLFAQCAKLKFFRWKNFGLKTAIAQTPTRPTIAHFKNVLGYEYKKCVSPKI